MGARGRHSVLDRWPARALAAAVVLACLAAMAYIARDRLFPSSQDVAGEGLNPDFVACRDQRLGEVRQMREDGLITADQLETFTARAIGYCADRFPPDAGGPG